MTAVNAAGASLEQADAGLAQNARVRKVGQQVLLVAAMAVFALTLDHSFAAAGIVTKLSTFCSAWIKPIYLGVLALGVLIACFKGGAEMVQEEGNGGRRIATALIAGSAMIAIPAAILAAVAATATFTCA